MPPYRPAMPSQMFTLLIVALLLAAISRWFGWL